MQGIRLDQYALTIQFPQQLLEHGTLVILACGVAGLGDRYAKSCRLKYNLVNKGRTAATGGLDRTVQGLAITG